MLRRKQEQEEVESEAGNTRRTWFWAGKRKAEASAVEQTETEPPESETLDAQLTALKKARAKRKTFLRVSNLGAGIAGSGVLSALIAQAMWGSPVYNSPASWLPLGLLFGGEALVLSGVLRGQTALRTAVGALASSDDLQAIGALTEALTLGEPYYSMAVAALTRLLPRLQPSDAELLNETQRDCLRRALKRSSSRLCFWQFNPHFANIILRALTTIGETVPAEMTPSQERTEQHSPNVEALLMQFQAAVSQRQKNSWAIAAGAVLGAGSSLANILAQSPPLLGVSVGAISLTLGLSFYGMVRLKAMMNELANAGDLRVIGPLVEIAAIQDGSANAMAALLLARLLPRLRATDAALLNGRQRAALGRTLTSNTKNPDFLVAALKALEQVGDGALLTVVEGLATGRISTADPVRVQAAARECLPFLRTRFDQQRASQGLLRASHVSQMPPGMLLRAARGAPDTGSEELLRPGTPRPEIDEKDDRNDISLVRNILNTQVVQQFTA